MSEQIAVAGQPRTESRNVIGSNPNATVALTSGSGVGALVIWIVGLSGLAMPAEVGAVVGGLIAAIALFVGRSGLKGALRVIWRGNQAG